MNKFGSLTRKNTLFGVGVKDETRKKRITIKFLK
jgi:hypothetical protein